MVEVQEISQVLGLGLVATAPVAAGATIIEEAPLWTVSIEKIFGDHAFLQRKDVQAIVNVVNGLGCGFITATTGATAWREFARSRFDLVIADLNMPGGDGGVLARRVRTRSTTPVVLLSELGAASLEICGIDELAGIEVVSKPLLAATLRDAIERQLELVLVPGQSTPGFDAAA